MLRGESEDGGGPLAAPGRRKTLQPPLRGPGLGRRVVRARVHGPGGKPRAPRPIPRTSPESSAAAAPGPARSPARSPSLPDTRQAPYPRGAGPRGALPRMSVPAGSAPRAPGPEHRAGARPLSRRVFFFLSLFCSLVRLAGAGACARSLARSPAARPLALPLKHHATRTPRLAPGRSRRRGRRPHI